MDQIRTEQLLYTFFVANGDSQISYRRLKNVVNSIIEIMRLSESPHRALSILMRSGLVEQTELSIYRLSPSCLLRGAEFMIGINLPVEKLDKLIGQLINKRDGLGIYRTSQHQIDIPVRNFSLREILEKCGSIASTFNNLLSETGERPNFRALERYDSIENKFVAQKEFINGPNLYRVYSFSNVHFDYYFEGAIMGINTFQSCTFERHDLETLNIFKLMLSLDKRAKGLIYRADLQELAIDQYFPFPNTIERILLHNSILTRGDLPEGRNYHLGVKDFGYLQKIFNNKIVTCNEEHI